MEEHEHERSISWALKGQYTAEFDFENQELRLSWSGGQTFLQYREMLMLRDFINTVLREQQERQEHEDSRRVIA